ncbi:MAG: DUF2231 domain-containing protein [Gemmatimonadaceae bacterium]
MRRQEVHPALVHYPLALVPASLVADFAGSVTNSESLLDLGKRLMPVAAASAAVAAVAGLAAQEEVRATGRTLTVVRHACGERAAFEIKIRIAISSARHAGGASMWF